jgi:NADP-dependent 3-hydroxy acid dehydrogenase YdfG
MDAFARASAARIILLGRQEKNLSSAIQRLRAERPSFLGQLIPYVCDISDESVVDHVWKDLNQKDIAIDTIVLNAAEMGSEGHIESNPLPRIWKTFEVNVRGNLDMVQRFVKQGKSMDFQGRKVSRDDAYESGSHFRVRLY